MTGPDFVFMGVRTSEEPFFSYICRRLGKADPEVISMAKNQDPKGAKWPRGDEEAPVPDIYPVLDNDLARDNVENDIPTADLEDLLPRGKGGAWDGAK